MTREERAASWAIADMEQGLRMLHFGQSILAETPPEFSDECSALIEKHALSGRFALPSTPECDLPAELHHLRMKIETLLKNHIEPFMSLGYHIQVEAKAVPFNNLLRTISF